MTARAVGIEALNVYAGVARIAVEALFEGRGLDPGRLANLMMTEKSVGLPCEDPVTNAVNAARYVGTHAIAVEAGYALSNSFGFGGFNSAVVLRQP